MIYDKYVLQLDGILNKYKQNGLLSGVLKIQINDRLIYHKSIGFANYEEKTPFSDNSIFTYYSISKPFCAIGLMKLWDKGKVDLDAHPGVYVPEAKGLHPKVTVRQLLQHISGVPDFVKTKEFTEIYATDDYFKAREHLRIISSYPTLFEPGTASFYANINFIIISFIIENLTGMDYGEYMQKEVFIPLGMKKAQVDLPDLSVADRVQGYNRENDKTVAVNKNIQWMRGAGDIIGTVDDLYCLNLAIKHRLLLSNEAWQIILTPSPINNMGFGCTLFSTKDKALIRHNGGSAGFRTLHLQIPEDDFDLIFLSNFGFGDFREKIIEQTEKMLFSNLLNDDKEMDKGYI